MGQPRSAIALPRTAAGDRTERRGLGDISISGRSWVLDTLTHPDWNILGGLGVKLPTGNARTQDFFPDRNGANNQLRYVDQSVQPGDGGWGLMMEAHGFWKMKRVFLFGSGSYLANPRNTNGTPSLVVARGGPPPAASSVDKLVNSVPDQYLARVGGTVPLWRGIAGTAVWRMEGLKRYDLFGASNGFRRPGTSMFVEPGVSFSRGSNTVTLNVPIAYYRLRRPDPNTGLSGDATFPRQVFLTSYSRRFGGRAVAPGLQAPPAASPSPAPEALRDRASSAAGRSAAACPAGSL